MQANHNWECIRQCTEQLGLPRCTFERAAIVAARNKACYSALATLFFLAHIAQRRAPSPPRPPARLPSRPPQTATASPPPCAPSRRAPHRRPTSGAHCRRSSRRPDFSANFSTLLKEELLLYLESEARPAANTRLGLCSTHS